MKYPKDSNIFMFILIIFLIFIGNGLINIIAPIILKLYPNVSQEEKLLILQAIFAIFSFIAPTILYMLIKRISIKDIIPLKPLSIKNILIIIFMSFAIQPMLQLIGAITNIFSKDEITDTMYVFASVSLPKALFVTAIIPAITEELTMRGVILSGYKKTSLLTGVLMSSFYFGIMHFTITQLFYAIVAGVIFALIVKVTKSIYASVLMHFIFNGTQITLASLVLKYFPEEVEKATILQTPTLQENFITILISGIQFLFSLPFLLLAIFLFIKVNKEEIKELKEENQLLKNSEDKPKVFTLFFYINILIYIIYMIILNYIKSIV